MSRGRAVSTVRPRSPGGARSTRRVSVVAASVGFVGWPGYGIAASSGVCQWHPPWNCPPHERERIMPKIRHLAVICMDPEKLAKFYSEVFEMKIVGRSGRNNVFLSDGYMNLALLSQKA